MPIHLDAKRDRALIRHLDKLVNGQQSAPALPGQTIASGRGKRPTKRAQNGSQRLPASADLAARGWQREYDGRLWLRWRNRDGLATEWYEDESEAAEAARGMEW